MPRPTRDSSVPGPALTVPGASLGQQGLTPATAADARAIVQKLKVANVDGIKIHRDDLAWASKRTFQLMAMDVLQAIVDEAHRVGLRAYVHAPQLARAKEALRTGVDGLLHGIIDEPIDQDFIGLMKKNSAVYVPTLGMFEDVADVTAFAKRQAPDLGSARAAASRGLRDLHLTGGGAAVQPAARQHGVHETAAAHAQSQHAAGRSPPAFPSSWAAIPASSVSCSAWQRRWKWN